MLVSSCRCVEAARWEHTVCKVNGSYDGVAVDVKTMMGRSMEKEDKSEGISSSYIDTPPVHRGIRLGT